MSKDWEEFHYFNEIEILVMVAVLLIRKVIKNR